ncbi:alkane 1-monooxygenase [Tenacibaculum bernardetii]|uniref:alkane 1-monooxygenase n=1 Tax=Tenacibaculum bernardetii TaxID=3021375 RepID=UPI0023B14528|nr:alkane 1-monooxygenase [Tenacibaculum bernardetii]
MKPLKYLSIVILPITVFLAFTNKGWITFLPILTFFVAVPFAELFFKTDKKNLNKEEALIEKENKLYTLILYATIPIQLLFVGWFFYVIQEVNLTTTEITGRILALGVMCGVIGINVGHELGHRNNRFDEFLGELLLLTSLNTHFLPYHNAGHHLNVATPKDAATARKNEVLYLFWIRSHITSYYQAWQSENKRLKSTGRNWFHYQNRMVIYTVCNLLFLGLIYFSFTPFVLFAFIGAAVFGIILLETINYIEHYGLLRKQLENGRYERVKRIHSWNSDHVIGQVLLFNLSRHSDHHYNGSKHYQLLKTVPESPQMPTGYPGMMLLSLIPPLWLLVMNKKLQEI